MLDRFSLSAMYCIYIAIHVMKNLPVQCARNAHTPVAAEKVTSLHWRWHSLLRGGGTAKVAQQRWHSLLLHDLQCVQLSCEVGPHLSA